MSGREKRIRPHITPVNDGTGRYIFGYGGNTNYRTKASPLQVLEYSAYEVKYWIDSTFSSLKMLVQGGVNPGRHGRPVGVVEMIGETYEGQPV